MPNCPRLKRHTIIICRPAASGADISVAIAAAVERVVGAVGTGRHRQLLAKLDAKVTGAALRLAQVEVVNDDLVTTSAQQALADGHAASVGVVHILVAVAVGPGGVGFLLDAAAGDLRTAVK